MEDNKEDDTVYGLEAMILILLDVIYDMKKQGLDYEDELEVLLEWDEEFKNNNFNNINNIEETDGFGQKEGIL